MVFILTYLCHVSFCNFIFYWLPLDVHQFPAFPYFLTFIGILRNQAQVTLSVHLNCLINSVLKRNLYYGYGDTGKSLILTMLYLPLPTVKYIIIVTSLTCTLPSKDCLLHTSSCVNSMISYIDFRPQRKRDSGALKDMPAFENSKRYFSKHNGIEPMYILFQQSEHSKLTILKRANRSV